MTPEDEEFNRIEREATARLNAVSAALSDHLEYLRKHMTEYERGVIDGRQMQAQSSVDKAVNAMSQRKWVGLTDEEVESLDCVYVNWLDYEQVEIKGEKEFARAIEAKFKEKNT